MTTITPEQRLTIVKHLASGKPIDAVATITTLDSEQVRQIGQSHGYPDTDKLAWAVDVLTKNLDKAAADAIPPATEGGQPIDSTPTPIHRTDPRPPTAPAQPDEIRVLLNAAKSAKPKRIQALANRIFDQLDHLRTLVDAEQEKVRASAVEHAAKAKARAEVQRLERELADARAKLTGKAPAAKPKSTPTDATENAGPSTAEVRSWAIQQGIDVPMRGVLSHDVREAYDTAHQAQAS